MSSSQIKIAIIGIGNCASSLIQGIHYYSKNKSTTGLLHPTIGSFKPSDIVPVLAFDVDSRKVNKRINEAIFANPNCTKQFCKDIPQSNVIVKMGKILDSVSDIMRDDSNDYAYQISSSEEPSESDVIQVLKASEAEILLNYLPVGSEEATRFYANCALKAGVAFINNIPVFIASDGEWSKKFKDNNIPLIGDDIKSQVGATIVHRALANLFKQRGARIERTYQLNTGGNTDFLNMTERSRLKSKKMSKTEAVQSSFQQRLSSLDINIGPSDYVPWQKDNKVAFIRIEGSIFGDIPIDIELRLSVEDSPNSAGVAIDMIRCCKLALMRKQGGVLEIPSAYFCKHPPKQIPDDKAYELLEKYISNASHKEIEFDPRKTNCAITS